MRSVITLIAAVCLAGCSTPRDIFALDGSRADGIIDVAYNLAGSPMTKADKQTGLTIASAKCAAWGYSGADLFGSARQLCISPSSLGCMGTQSVIKYQCLGNPDAGGHRNAFQSSSGSWSEQDSLAASKDEQIRILMTQNLPYEEYQARYRQIMGNQSQR